MSKTPRAAPKAATKQGGLIRSSAIFAGLTMVSRVMGLVRDLVITARLGASQTIAADAYYTALAFPNLFRRIFAEGAFAAAFVPVFARSLQGEGREEARRLADQTLAVLASVLLVLVLAVEIAMPLLVSVMAPGFTADPAKFDLTVELTRITFPSLLLISLVALFGGMLTSTGRFAAFAAAPILLNLALIGAALYARASPAAGAGHALAWGVSLGGVAQLLLLVVALRRAGLMPRFTWPRLTPGVKKILVLFGPAAFGAGIVQINLLVDQFIASFLPTGAISYLYYADRINQLPLGVIGIAVGTALLPLLSRQIQAGDRAGADDSQSRAVELVMVFCLPSAAALTVIARPIIAVLFERGAFDAATTDASAAALVAFAVGLPAYVLIKVFAPGFFARQDTKTPVKIAVVGLVSNIALNLAFIWHLGHVGIALATACAAWINGGLLWWVLVRRGHFRADERLKQRMPRLLLATGLMTAALWAASWAMDADALKGTAQEALQLVVFLVVGLGVYGVAGHLLGAFSLRELRAMMTRRRLSPVADQDSGG
ncbi:MAG: murein biosynthesis integral membrane protein MurJ [Caulobacter sp.]|nr:murein biosynthesis integral membrane protein MurJ [Caulobacter sp.]